MKATLISLLPLAAGFHAGAPVRPPVGGASEAVSQRAAVNLVAAPPKSEFDKATFDTSIDEIPKCPLTKWDSEAIDLNALEPPARTIPTEMRPTAEGEAAQKAYIAENREQILSQLTESGAIWLRDFDLIQELGGRQVKATADAESVVNASKVSQPLLSKIVRHLQTTPERRRLHDWSPITVITGDLSDCPELCRARLKWAEGAPAEHTLRVQW